MYWRPAENKCGGMENEDETKKLNDDVVVFVRKRSDTEAPKYTARLKKYVDFQKKRRRATNARYSANTRERKASASRKKIDADQKDNAPENTEHPGNDDDRMSRRGAEQKCMHNRSYSRSHSNAPSDKCCRRRRRRRSRTLGSGGMESDEDKKKLNDEVALFMSTRNVAEAPRYAPRLQKLVELQQKRRRANYARSRASNGRTSARNHVTRARSQKSRNSDAEQKDTGPEYTEHQGNNDDRMSRRGGQKCMHTRSHSRSHSNAPSDRCCRRRRRRRSRRRRRRRSCGRRRRRRRRSRRRRRRSCRRRRRRRRRRRC